MQSILLDNVRFHYCKAVKELACKMGWELLFVPPYSPWFNPIEIEGIFSIIKRAYYKQLSIDDSIKTVTSQHLQAFFKHSLYHQGFCGWKIWQHLKKRRNNTSHCIQAFCLYVVWLNTTLKIWHHLNKLQPTWLM